VLSGGPPRNVLAVLLFGMLPLAAAARAQPVCPDAGALIGRITIERVDVFDAGGAGLTARLNRTANAIHVRTRERVVSRELLFREGEPCQSEALAQTERNLRALGLFQEVDVVPAKAPDGRINVLVWVQDAWSLRITGRYQRAGGVPAWDLGLTEANIAGQGVAAGVRRREAFDADVTTGWLEERRLLGSRERLAAFVDDRSDGHAFAASISRPFYALDTRWAHDLSFAETRDVLRIYQDGDLAAAHDRRVAEIVAGFSARLTTPTPTTVWRLGAGYRFAAQEYPASAREERLDPDAPITHRWAGPYASLQFTEHRFLTCTGLVVPGRDVDVNLGTQADVGVFFSPRVGAWHTTSRVALGATVSRGWRLPGAGVFVARAAATALTAGGETARAGVSGSARAWWQLSSTHVLTAGGEAQASIRPEPGYRVYLGGSPGLKGYGERAFQGTRSALFTVEDRAYAAWTPAGLVQFGAAAFIEAGAVGGDAVTSGRGRVLVDAGIGLRVATLRSSANGTIRIDVAYPLTRPPDGRRHAQLVIGYRNDF